MTSFLVVAVLIGAPAPLAGTPEIVAIHITQSGWGFKERNLALAKSGNAYSDRTYRVSSASVSALVQAALAAPVPSLDPTRFQIDQHELRAAAQQLASKSFPPKTASRFVEWATNPSQMPALVRNLYQSMWTDDSPTARVEVTFSGGRRVVLSSSSQHPFMVPWHVEDGEKSWQTFEPTIGIAIAELLPAKFLNKDRLAGRAFATVLVRHAEHGIRGHEFETEAADEKVGPDVEALKSRFNIQQAMVGYMGSFEVDFQDVWTGRLSTPDYPGVTFDLSLSMQGTHAHSPDAFLRDADGMGKRIRALPWLVHQIDAGEQILIGYFDDRSVSPKAKKDVVESLNGKLSPATVAALNQAVAFWLVRSWFILLPDGRSLLLHGRGLPAGLSLREGDFVKPDGSVEPGW
jgi:hypothetical protein